MSSDYCSESWERAIQEFLHRPEKKRMDAIREHTRTCEICRHTLDEHIAFRQLFRHLSTSHVSPGFDNRLQSRIQRIESEKRSPLFRYFEWFSLLLTLIIGGMIVIIFYVYMNVLQKESPVNEPENPPNPELVLPIK